VVSPKQEKKKFKYGIKFKETGITSNAALARDISDQFLHTQMFAQHRCKIHHVQSPNS
jgi:hypothetical protein